MTSTPQENQQTQPETQPSAAPPVDGATIVAPPGQYYRNTRYLMTVLLIGMGLWFGYDGYVRYPHWNQLHEELEKKRTDALARGNHAEAQRLLEEENKYPTHNEAALNIQKLLCFALPPLAIVLLTRSLYKSRGQYRLEGTTLYLPGHPPVPFANITEIDKHLWDRKGIAYISYDLGEGRQGKLTLDDFLYDRPPTDEIFDRIEKYVTPQAATPTQEEGAQA